MKPRILKLHPDAKVPTYQSEGAGCFDLYAATVDGNQCIGSTITYGTPVVCGTPLPPPGVNIAAGNWTAVTDCHYYTADQMQTYAQHARADLEAENQRLREALHRIDSVAVFLPAFEVLHEGGIEAVTQNIVKAISEAVSALEKQP